MVRDDLDAYGCALTGPLLAPGGPVPGHRYLIPQGHGLVFTTRDRPVKTRRGWSVALVRHGVSMVRSGQRFALGLVFHDAA